MNEGQFDRKNNHCWNCRWMYANVVGAWNDHGSSVRRYKGQMFRENFQQRTRER